MKKIFKNLFCMLMSVLVVLSFSSCINNKEADKGSKSDSQSAEITNEKDDVEKASKDFLNAVCVGNGELIKGYTDSGTALIDKNEVKAGLAVTFEDQNIPSDMAEKLAEIISDEVFDKMEFDNLKVKKENDVFKVEFEFTAVNVEKAESRASDNMKNDEELEKKSKEFFEKNPERSEDAYAQYWKLCEEEVIEAYTEGYKKAAVDVNNFELIVEKADLGKYVVNTDKSTFVDFIVDFADKF